MNEEWEFRIAKLDLQDGDVLVVKDKECRPTASQHHVLRELVPDGVKILYISDDIELSVLTKAQIEALAA